MPLDPGGVTGDVGRADGASGLLDRRLQVLLGDWRFQLGLLQPADLIGAFARNLASHRHHRRVPERLFEFRKNIAHLENNSIVLAIRMGYVNVQRNYYMPDLSFMLKYNITIVKA